MVEAAVERYGGVHVLFNNVGILGREAWWTLTKTTGTRC